MRVCATLTLLGSVALRSAAAGQAQAPADPSREAAPLASTERVLIYGGNDSFPPYEFLDANRQPAGFNVALIRALAQEANLPVTVSLGRWRERMAALERGQVDLVSMAATDDRLRRFGLLVQTWTLQQSVLFAQGRGTYPRNLDELGAETIALEPRALMDDLLRRLPEVRRPVLIAADNQVDAVRRVLAGQVSGAAGNSLALRYTARALGATTLVEVPVKSLAYHIATQRGREPEFAWMAPALAELRASGRFERLVEQHLALPDARATSPVGRYLLLLSAGVALLWLGTVAWTRSLRRQVRVQTLALQRTLDDRESLARLLQGMLEGTASLTGEKFFQSLVRNLGLALDVDHAVVAELVGPAHTRVRTIAAWRIDRFGVNVEYDLAGTVVEHLIGHGLFYSTSDLITRFPSSPVLKEDGVRSCLGAPLIDSTGQPIGGLVVLHSTPLVAPERAETAVRIFAARAAAELERQRAAAARRQAEEERRQLESQVQHTQKLESLGVLAGGIAHDFNNLLVGVLGHAELARKDVRAGSSVDQRLRQIETAALRASELTNQMLAYSGKGKFLVESIDLTALVREMAELLEVSISKKAQLRYECDPHTPAIDGDQTQIRQVVMNLLTNASEAIGDQEGTIVVRIGTLVADAVYLARSAAGSAPAPGPYVFFEVQDNGCGMDVETSARIFDPFFTTKFTGRGLGLAATLGIVRGHGGGIRIQSAPGQGSTFTVFMPGGRRVVPNEVEARREPPPAIRGRLVLVVDDEPDVRRVAQAALVHAGLSVLTAADGREALALIEDRRHAIEAVVLDLTMPIMGGVEVLARLRRIRPDLAVLLSSGYTEPEVTRTIGTREHCAFIQKPYRSVTLVEEVQKLLVAHTPLGRAARSR